MQKLIACVGKAKPAAVAYEDRKPPNHEAEEGSMNHQLHTLIFPEHAAASRVRKAVTH